MPCNVVKCMLKDRKGGEAMYTTREIAEMFKWNIETVRRKIYAGKIKAVKIGKGYRISEEEVERLKRGE